jgi:cytoplasmic tRNA 2-thiolation protein 2
VVNVVLTSIPYTSGVTFYHPLRDLFKKELVTYAFEITQPSLIPLCGAYSSIPKHSPAAATSGRNITVGELMTQYFDSMEVQYPSTVSNVVRMGDRLKPSSSKTKTCSLCGLFIDEGANDLTLGAQGQQVEAGEMCYGCMRSTHGASRLASLLTINLGS